MQKPLTLLRAALLCCVLHAGVRDTLCTGGCGAVKGGAAARRAGLAEARDPVDLTLDFPSPTPGLSRALLASLLPPCIVVEEARCELVKIKVPWTRLKKAPVCVVGGQVSALYF